MANTLTLASSKGGTGKTTTALNLSVALAERGLSTTVLDLDPQGAIGFALARSDTEWAGLAEYVVEGGQLDDYLVQTKLSGLSILPRGRLDPADTCEYEQSLHSTDAMTRILGQLAQRCDYVILDTPSGLGMTTRAALAVSDYVLIPLQAEPMAFRSIGQVLRVIEHVQQHENSSLRLLGILPTMVQLGHESSFNVMASLWTGFGGVLETTIPRAEVFAVASERGLPVSFLGGRSTPEARRFEILAVELESRIAALSGENGDGDERAQRELL